MPVTNVAAGAFFLGSAVLMGGAGMPVAAQSTQPVTIRFAAQVGDLPFDCGTTYALGSPATPMRVADFRFYVSELHLIDASGRAVPVQLEQDGTWQLQNVALLDFEDRSGACANGTPETRDQVVGTVPPGTYVGLRFQLGIPFDLNHGDVVVAASPLNLTSLWWNWRGGYKFVRIDLETAPVGSWPAAAPLLASSTVSSTISSTVISHGSDHGGDSHAPGGSGGFAIHLGSTDCQAAAREQQPTQECQHPNHVEVTFPTFDPATDRVVADLGALVAAADVRSNQPDTPSGCMSGREDRDCESILSHFGITGSQQFFRQP